MLKLNRSKAALYERHWRSPPSTRSEIAFHLEVSATRLHDQGMRYHGFPSRLHHEVPHWVEPGSLFHIRIRLDWKHPQRELTDPILASSLLESARFYQINQRWHITLFLLMPDHLHALLSFARDRSMSEVVSAWKRYQTSKHHVLWQENYFDHRLRDDERGEQLTAKMNYIRQNPAAKGLCAKAKDWPWVIDSRSG